MPVPSPRRRRSVAADGPDPVDIHVGARVRLRRVLMGLSQNELAQAIGVAFQQVQKYEHATNRISASVLHRLARILDVPIAFFFDDLPEDLKLPATDGEALRQVLDLMRSYGRLPERIRQPLRDLVRAMAVE